MNAVVRTVALFLVLAALRAEALAAPNEWNAVLIDHDYAPSMLIAVDKNSQQLYTFEKHSPMSLVLNFPCTTGQAVGDKINSGDLKTPEGVYFVVRHIDSGLDYLEYGNEAYTLNYPNPVDRLRKKTGYGIWIHGKGVPLTPLATRGCIALNNPDVSTLGDKDLVGRPVVLAATVQQATITPKNNKAVAEQLVKKVQDWASAWGSRSTSMFDFYDAEAYSLAQGESFSGFRKQKESLFKRLNWIKTSVSNIQVLEGPDYWVTWFYQEYKAPNLTSDGVRRLYWQADAKGELRIVGMEWVRGDRPAYMLADAGKRKVSDASPQAEKKSSGAVNRLVSETAQSKAPAPELAAAETQTLKTPPARQAEAKLTAAAKTLTDNDVIRFVELWRTAWEAGNIEVYAACYAKNAVQDNRKGRSAITDHKKGIWKRAAPAKVGFSNITVRALKNGEYEVTLRQYYENVQGYSDLGEKTLWLQSIGGSLFIASEIWKVAL